MMKANYREINHLFNSLENKNVYDNTYGCASITANKTSVYLFNNKKCIARLVNISTTNIDEVDDFSLSIDNLIDLICVLGTELDGYIVMNTKVYGQLIRNLYNRNPNNMPKRIDTFNGAIIIIDDEISCNQEKVA